MTEQKSPKITITKQDGSTVLIEGELDSHLLEEERSEALKTIGKNIKIDGFRPGNIPDSVVEKQVGELAILEEMAQRALAKWYPIIVTENNIEAIGRPAINITKLALGNPLGFTITTAVMPTIDLADYKKIAKKANKQERLAEVSDQEVEEAVTQLRKFRAQAQMDEEKAKKAKEAGEQFTPTKLEDVADEDLPELTLEYVQALGEFESVEDFTQKLRDNLLAEKEKRNDEERRMEIIDNVLDGTTFDIPELLVQYEIDRAMAQMQHDISMSGLTFEDYLETIKKTEKEVREDLRETASKRAKTRLVIESIARAEEITPDAEKMEQEVQALLEMYKDNKNASEESIRAYVAEIMLNQDVFSFLDGIQ